MLKLDNNRRILVFSVKSLNGDLTSLEDYYSDDCLMFVNNYNQAFTLQDMLRKYRSIAFINKCGDVFTSMLLSFAKYKQEYRTYRGIIHTLKSQLNRDIVNNISGYIEPLFTHEQCYCHS